MYNDLITRLLYGYSHYRFNNCDISLDWMNKDMIELQPCFLMYMMIGCIRLG